MLYIVSTPIGNLEDITFRALKTLFSVDLILAEDTRKTLALLNHFKKPENIIPQLLSFYEENELKRLPEVIDRLQNNQEIALVTNAGTPTVSDPGFKLVRECVNRNIRVVPIPGASSILAALAASGLPTNKFIFIGFPPNRKNNRLKFFLETKNIGSTVIFFESPYRLVESLSDLESVFGDIEIILAKEISKIFEDIQKGQLSKFLNEFKTKPPKGEYVILYHLERSLASA